MFDFFCLAFLLLGERGGRLGRWVFGGGDFGIGRSSFFFFFSLRS